MVISGLEAEGQGSQVKLKKSAVSQRMGHKGRGQRGRAVCIQIKGSPKTFFFSLGPLFHHIQRAFISFPALFTTLASPHWLLIPQPQTFSVAAQNVYCTYKAKKFWRSSVLLYIPTLLFLFCATYQWFITEMGFLECCTRGLASSTKCWAVCKVSGVESKVTSKLQFRKDSLFKLVPRKFLTL